MAKETKGLPGSPDEGGRALRPRARLLKTLGEELISNETVALIELVKNAYDADAHTVLIRFGGPLTVGQGHIEVFDDGHGMTMDVVEKAWMEPATDIKKKTTHSRNLKRRFLGEKGIGRFAAARLAAELDLITRPEGSSKEIYGLFDWTQFDDENRYLDQIMILTEERDAKEVVPSWPLARYQRDKKDLIPSPGSQGTILRMNRIKRDWGHPELSDLQRGLSRLVSPFLDSKDFSIHLELPEEFQGYTQGIRPPEIIKYPHYSVRGSVNADGEYDISIKVETERDPQAEKGLFVMLPGKERREVRDIAGGTAEKELKELTKENPQARIQCGPFAVELRVWDRDELDNLRQKLGTGIRSIQSDLNALAGINIYRDGFRVLPYGEPDDDWLRLDIRRVQNPTMRLSNNQISGYISISADANPGLHDQSNREGLDDNQAYYDLQELVKVILSKLEAIRHGARRKPKKPETGSGGEGGIFQPVNLDEIKERIQEKLPGDAVTIALLERTEQEYAKRIDDIKEVLARYHSLATLGQLVDKLIHEGRQPLASIQNDAGLGKETLEGELEGESKTDDLVIKASVLGEAIRRFLSIVEQADVLHMAFKRMEPFGGRQRGRPKKIYMEELVKSAFELYGKELQDLKVHVTLPDTETLVRVDPAEFQEVLVNLLTNSLYWLGTVPDDKRRILVKITRLEGEHVEIIFADSGSGVSTKHRDQIFEPYFSLKPDGVGLGLSITGEIIKDYYDGTLELMNSGPLKGAVFRIVLRKRV